MGVALSSARVRDAAIRALLGLVSGNGQRARLSILVFHRVRSSAFADERETGATEATSFAELMEHVRDQFNILPASEAFERLRSGSLTERALVITFDDGYADNLELAGPVLSRLGIPAIVFVATGFLDGGCMWNDIVRTACQSTSCAVLELSAEGLGDYSLRTPAERQSAIDGLLQRLKYEACDLRDAHARRIADLAKVSIPRDLMLSRSGVRALADFGIEIGAHTCSHPILATLPDDRARREIVDSRHELEDITGRPVLLFAYPNGIPGRDYLKQHVRMVKEAGFASAVTTAWGAASADSDPLQLPRFTPWRSSPAGFDLLMLRNLCRTIERA